MIRKPNFFKSYKLMTALVSLLLVLSVVLSIVIALSSKNKDTYGASTSVTSFESVSSAIPEKETSSSIAVEEQSSSQAPQIVSKTVSKTTENKQPSVLQTASSYNPPVSTDYFSDAMFVGDSITTGIDLYNIVNNAPVIAYTGINTSTVMSRAVIKQGGSKLTFLQAMSRYNPKKIYVMMGINGIAFQSKSNLVSNYKTFILAIKKQHPKAVIYVQSILPVTAKKASKDSRFKNSKINDYNEAIKQMAKECGVYYLDVASAFKDQYGNLPNEASPNDGIHFGTKYYKIWIDYLRKNVLHEKPQNTTSSASQTSSTVSTAPPVSSNTSSDTTTSSNVSSVESSEPSVSEGNTSSSLASTESSEITSRIPIPSVPRN